MQLPFRGPPDVMQGRGGQMPSMGEYPPGPGGFPGVSGPQNMSGSQHMSMGPLGPRNEMGMDMMAPPGGLMGPGPHGNFGMNADGMGHPGPHGRPPPGPRGGPSGPGPGNFSGPPPGPPNWGPGPPGGPQHFQQGGLPPMPRDVLPPAGPSSAEGPRGSGKLLSNDYCQHFVDTGQRPQNFLRGMLQYKTF